MARRKWFGALGLCVLALGTPIAAEAGGNLVEPVPIPSAWTFDGGLYGWALWVGGDVTARGETFSVYADPIDLIEHLDGPIIMANFEAKRGPFALYADVVYAKFAMDSDFVGEAQPIQALTLKGDGRIGADYTFGVYQADTFYEFANFTGANGNSTTFEIGGGARYVQQKLDITAKIDVSAQVQLGKLLDRLENRIQRIEAQEARLESLARLNALRTALLEERIVRAGNRGLKRRVARLENSLKNVEGRGEAIAALETLDRLRLALLQRALNLDGKEFTDELAFVNTGTMDWVDPVVAMRVTHALGNGHSVTAMGDVGGFNADRNFSWQAVLTYDCEGTLFGYETTTSIGYKALGLKFEEQTSKGTRGVDVILHGPLAEIAFRW